MAPSWWPQVKQIFDDYGVPMEVWVPIMWGESRGNPSATNDTRGRTDLPAGTVPELSVGLFQVNLLARYPNATEAEMAAYVEQMKDPVYNATQQGARIAAAWNAVKDKIINQPGETWAPVVAVRSGHPGGSITNPCVSDWCKRYQGILQERARNMLPLIQGSIDFFNADWMGKLAGFTSGAAASPLGAIPSIRAGLGSTVAGPARAAQAGANAAAAIPQAAVSTLQAIIAKIDWLTITVYVVGVLLFAFAVQSIFNERVIAPTKKTLIKAATDSVGGSAELAEAFV